MIFVVILSLKKGILFIVLAQGCSWVGINMLGLFVHSLFFGCSVPCNFIRFSSPFFFNYYFSRS